MDLKFASTLKIAVTILTTFQLNLYSHYVVVDDKAAGSHVFAVDPNATFNDVITDVANHMSAECAQTNRLELRILPENYELIMQLAKKPRAGARNYMAGVSPSEASDITFIVKTLANSSLPKIKTAESSLKKAGDRIDHVHPLQFLLSVFLNEELKVAVRNLQGRAWVWDDFRDGITQTLAEENSKNNILPYLQDFAFKIRVDVNILLPLQQAGRWEKFVTTLIDVVPRADGSGRHDQ